MLWLLKFITISYYNKRDANGVKSLLCPLNRLTACHLNILTLCFYVFGNFRLFCVWLLLFWSFRQFYDVMHVIYGCYVFICLLDVSFWVLLDGPFFDIRDPSRELRYWKYHISLNYARRERWDYFWYERSIKGAVIMKILQIPKSCQKQDMGLFLIWEIHQGSGHNENITYP